MRARRRRREHRPDARRPRRRIDRRERPGAAGRGPGDHEGADAEPDLGLGFHALSVCCDRAQYRVAIAARRDHTVSAIWTRSSRVPASFEQFQCFAETRVTDADRDRQRAVGRRGRPVRATLARARFVDGRETAGFAARLVKNNRQADGRPQDRDDAQAGRGAHPRQRGVSLWRCGRRRSRRSCSRATSRACTTAATSTTR